MDCWSDTNKMMMMMMIRGGTGGEKGRGRVPPGYYGFPPGPMGARIVTGSDVHLPFSNGGPAT